MSLESAITFFIAILIFGITPGPGVFATLAKAMVQGGNSCFFLIFGMAASDAVYLVLACFGLAAIAQNYGELFTVIRFAGAAYLLYLGWKMFTTKPDLELEAAKAEKTGAWLSLLQGFLISASNPKVILFYVAFLPTFMDLTVLTTADIGLAVVLTLVGLIMGMMGIAYSAEWAASKLRSPKAVQRLNRSAGSIMMGAGVFLAAKS